MNTTRTGIDPHDPLDLDGQLDDTERAVADTVATWCHDRVTPHIADWYDTAHLPVVRELAAELGDLGLLGMHLTGYGCAGASAVAYGLACRELEACDSAIRSLVSVQGSLAMYAIHRYGSTDHKQQWLPGMAAGRLIGCFGLTEPDHGSDPAGMRTHAHRDGTDWILSGTKTWITNGTIADIAIIWARTDDGIAGFIVPTTTPGFTATTITHKLSLRASTTATITLDNVRLPADARLPHAHGLSGPLRCLGEARYGIIWGAAGAARACLDTAIDYTTGRHQFGKPLAGFQLTQAKLADMTIAVHNSLLLALHLGRLKDTNRLRPEQVSYGKLANTRAALDVARTARSLLGANGISGDYPIMRHLSNLETVITYEGTAEMHTLVLGQALTGVNAFR